MAGDTMIKRKEGRRKQSRKIPHWLWIIIAKSLGIKLNSGEKPMVAIVLHAITLFSGGGMLLTRVWFSGYDIQTDTTETSILDGFVAVLMVTLFVTLGVYAQRLAHRLFDHPQIMENMRLHSKTVAKVNVALITFICMIGFVFVVNWGTFNYTYFYDSNFNMTNFDQKTDSANISAYNPCQTVGIPVEICQVMYFSQLVFSVFFLLWNGMVAVVLISVARTHTISIRKFIGELEVDACLHDQKLRESLYSKGSHEAKDSFKMYNWNRENHEDQARQRVLSMTIHDDSNADENAENNIIDEDEDPTPTFDSQVQLELNDEHVQAVMPQQSEIQVENSQNSTRPSLRKRFMGRFRKLSEDEDDQEMPQKTEPKMMSEAELLHKYWKLVNSTNLTSNALQRWMCCVTITTLTWSAIRIVYWLSHSPTLCGVLSLILPLVILPLLASAYSEVNYEGQIVLQSILPTPERTPLFRYFVGVPIQLSVYGHPIRYSTMGTVLAAILAAFASKILLQEMNKVL